MAHVIQLALGALISSLGVKGRTESWEAHERNQQFGENESIDIGKSQGLRKKGNARINNMSAMWPGVAKIIEKVLIWTYFESPETDLHIAENACCIDYVDTWLSKWGHWLSKAKVRIAVLPILGVQTHSNSNLELLQRAYQLQEFTHEWLQNSKYCDYRPLLTPQDEWTIVKYVIEVLRPFWYSTLWRSKRHTVWLHYVIRVYNDMFDYMDGVLRALAKELTQWKEDLFFAVKLARHKLSKYHAEVTPMMGKLLISAQIIEAFRKLRSFRKWDKGMDITPEDETFYTTQYHEAFLKYVENEYCAKHRRVPVNIPEYKPSRNLIPSALASRSGYYPLIHMICRAMKNNT